MDRSNVVLQDGRRGRQFTVSPPPSKPLAGASRLVVTTVAIAGGVLLAATLVLANATGAPHQANDSVAPTVVTSDQDREIQTLALDTQTTQTTAASLVPQSTASMKSVVGSKEWVGGPGVAVCYPGSSQTCIDKSTGKEVTGSESIPDYGWQCSELAVRFWDSMHWANDKSWWGGYGYQFYAIGQKNKSMATVHPNGDGYLPVHGDLIVTNYGGSDRYGHVAVVDYTDSSREVHVMEQNWSASGKAVYDFVGGKLHRNNEHREILGVVHANANSSGSGGSSGAGGSTGTGGSAAGNTGYRATVTASAGLHERSGPGTDFAAVGFLPYRAPVTIECQERGRTAVGGSNVWDKLSDGHWVTDYWLSTPNFNAFSPGIRQCPQGSGLDGGPRHS